MCVGILLEEAFHSAIACTCLYIVHVYTWTYMYMYVVHVVAAEHVKRLRDALTALVRTM